MKLSPDIEIKPIDREHVYYRHIRGRSLIYLEHNVWIDLEEGKYSEVLLLLRELKQRGRILCPLSFATVEELLDQPTQELRERRAALMDELSDGIIIRDPFVREQNEVLSLFSGQNRSQALWEQGYTFAVEFLGDMVIRPADRSLLAQKVAEFCANHMQSANEIRSVLWLVRHLDLGIFHENHKQHLQDYLQRIQADLDETRPKLQAINKANRREHALHEMRMRQFVTYSKYIGKESIFDSQNEPIRATSSERRIFSLIKEHQTTQDERVKRRIIAELFHQIPTVELRHQYYVGAYLGNRNPKPQDFYDVEHLVTIPYVHFFVNADGYVLQTLKATNIPQQCGCEIVPGVSHLLGHLGSLMKV